MNFSSTIRVNKVVVVGLGFIVTVIVLIYRNGGSEEEPRLNDAGIVQDDGVSLKELLSAAIDAAVRGGHEVRRVREEATLHMQSKGKTKEGVNDPVTDGDMKSHIVMFYSLQKAFPDLEIISEEHDIQNIDHSSVSAANIRDSDIEKLLVPFSRVEKRDVTVWIDPLDATKEYTEDLRQYVTVMVCVAVRGVPVLGVVHRPFSNVTHWGWVDKAVSPDLELIKQKLDSSPSLPPPTTPRLTVSISHQGAVKEQAAMALGSVDILPAAGAGYKILEVIQGDADAYVHTTAIKKWDLCAGHALLSAVGGRLTSLGDDSHSVSSYDIDYGNRQQYKNNNGVLATVKNHEYYLKKLQVLKTAVGSGKQ